MKKGSKVCGLTALILGKHIGVLACRRSEGHGEKCRAFILVVGYRDLERKHVIEWIPNGDKVTYEKR